MRAAIDCADAAGEEDLEKLHHIWATHNQHSSQESSDSTEGATSTTEALVAAAESTEGKEGTVLMHRFDKNSLLKSGFSLLPVKGGASTYGKGSIEAALCHKKLQKLAEVAIFDKGYKECTSQELYIKTCPSSGSSTVFIPEVKTGTIFPFWGNLHYYSAKKPTDIRMKVCSCRDGLELYLGPDDEYPCSAFAAHVATDSEEATFSLHEETLEIDLGPEDEALKSYFKQVKAPAPANDKDKAGKADKRKKEQGGASKRRRTNEEPSEALEQEDEDAPQQTNDEMIEESKDKDAHNVEQLQEPRQLSLSELWSQKAQAEQAGQATEPEPEAKAEAQTPNVKVKVTWYALKPIAAKIGCKDVPLCRSPASFDQKNPVKALQPLISGFHEKIGAWTAATRRLASKGPPVAGLTERPAKKHKVDINKIPAHLKHILG